MDSVPETLTQSESNTKRDLLIALALTLILIFGAAVRLVGVNWDADQHLHPDERFLTMVETALSLPGTKVIGATPPASCGKWGGYFDTACSPLSPYNHNFGFFVYGTFPIFLTRIVGEVLSMTGYGEINLVGRVLSALFDLTTVALIFFVGRRMYGTRVGLLAALFLAASALDIQQAHFFTVDTFTNVPILLAFWFALDIADGPSTRSGWLRAFVFAGAAFGLALAGRINIAPFAAVLIAAAFLRAYLGAELARKEHERRESLLENDVARQVREMYGPREIREKDESRETPTLSLTQTLSRAFGGLVVCALIALIAFRVLQPYAANGPSFFAPTIPKFDLSRGLFGAGLDVALSWAGGVNPQFVDNMNSINDFITGKADYPPNHQWTNRPAYIFPLENILLWGLGLPLGIAAWLGFAYAAYRLVFKREWQHLLIVVWVGITFAYTGQQFAKTIRYFLPLYPFLCLLAAWFLFALWDKVTAGRRRQITPNVIASEAKQSPNWNLEIASSQSFGSASLRSGSLLAMTEGGRRSAVSGRLAVLALFAIVIGYTLFWSLAFTTIYTRPVSRVTASRWIFENVPVGSIIANEHWDDPLPLRVDGKDPFGGMYRGLKSSSDGLMQWYAEDTPEKREQAIRWLDEADYIVLSSNRLYKAIPRLPMRYPLTTKYYEWLFDGTLGFENVAIIHSRPSLLGIEIADDDAEESFTVYDHPKVLIFKKSARYSHDNTAALFNGVNLTEVYRFQPVTATQAKTALLLTEADWDAQRAGGTWRDIFNPDDFINRIPALGWLALIEILGVLVFPLAFVVFRALADRGYIFAKALGILIPAWLAWLFASMHLLGFSRGSIFVAIVLLAAFSAFLAWRNWREIAAYVRAHAALIAVEEILFLLFFVFFLFIRFGNPDLWHPNFGGEKPMDFAYLNAVIKSTWFPPYDPWFAGGFINYYYFGMVITATLIKFSGIVPEVAYNLALPMYFALTALGAFSVVYNLASRQSPVASQQSTIVRASSLVTRHSSLFFALLAALLVAVIGNLGQLVVILDSFLRIGGGSINDDLPRVVVSVLSGIAKVIFEGKSFDVPTGNWYWTATRVIPETINEFPFFTFLYADLHAHLMALPFTLVVIGLCVNFALRARDKDDAARLPISPTDLIEVAVAALVFGALRAINFADFFPTYFGLILCALAIGEYARRGAFDWGAIGAVAWRFIVIIVLATLFYQPFVSNFATAYLNIEVWSGARTKLAEYLTVHGIFLFAAATFLVLATFDTPARRGIARFLRLAFAQRARFVRLTYLHRALVAYPTPTEDLALIGFSVLVIAEFLLVIAGFTVFALVLPLGILAAGLVLRPELDPARRFIALMIGAALALTLMVEVITYKGDIGRMNTVFKYYLQVWVFLGVAGAAGLAVVSGQWSVNSQQPSVRASRFTLHASLPKLWWVLFTCLLATGLLYPIFATRAKVNDRFVTGDSAGLNGMDYMNGAVYYDQGKELPLVFDREAIQWLRENVQGSPVILEGNAGLYHWGNRVSIYTGLPTIIGWDWHQKQQRSIVDGAIIDARLAAVRQIYSARDWNLALEAIIRYRVAYVYIGDMERAFYDAQGLAKFDVMAQGGFLELVYQNERVKIYRVKVS